jgi:hypothetical protein
MTCSTLNPRRSGIDLEPAHRDQFLGVSLELDACGLGCLEGLAALSKDQRADGG